MRKNNLSTFPPSLRPPRFVDKKGNSETESERFLSCLEFGPLRRRRRSLFTSRKSRVHPRLEKFSYLNSAFSFAWIKNYANCQELYIPQHKKKPCFLVGRIKSCNCKVGASRAGGSLKYLRNSGMTKQRRKASLCQSGVQLSAFSVKKKNNTHTHTCWGRSRVTFQGLAIDAAAPSVSKQPAKKTATSLPGVLRASRAAISN